MNKKLLTAFCLLLGIGTLVSLAQTSKGSKKMDEIKKQTEVMATQKDPMVKIKTSLGDIVVRFYNDTPLHRDNFLKLVKDGFYDGVLFHRVIKGFMVQTGDPQSRGADAGAMLGSGDPGYTIEAEIDFPRHYHKYGALAAARTGDQVNPERRSSGSQFYIVTGNKMSEGQIAQMEARMADQARMTYFRNLCKREQGKIDSLRQSGNGEALEALRQELIKETEENVAPVTMSDQMKADYTTVGGAPHLDGQYTVFGEVVEGMDVVEKIQNVETGAADRPKEDIRILGTELLK